MLSKKMAFSLTSLITILALAFVVTPAMAQDFDATFSAMDVSFAGDTQLDASTGTDGEIEIYLTFGHVVILADVDGAFGATADADGTGGGVVNVYNKFGAPLDAASHTVVVTARDLDPDATDVRNDGKSYMITIGGLGDTDADNTNPVKVEIFLAEGKIDDANPAESKKNKKGSLIVNLVGADPDPTLPMPIGIELANSLLVPDAGFTGDSFDIIVTLSEQPKENKFTKDHLAVDKGTAADGIYLDAMDPPTGNAATGRSGDYQRFLVKITPKAEDGDLVIKMKSFEDQEMPTPNKYNPPTNDLVFEEGTDKLTVKIKKKTTGPAKVAGVKFGLPKEKYIPAGGYLVVTEDKGGSSVHVPPGEIKEAPKAHERTPAELKYNVIDDGDLPNLETFLSNGGAIGVMGPHALMITEIMWGSDASLDDPGKSQWIELYNAGAGYQTQDGDNTTYLVFYGPGEAPTTGLHDLAGTVDGTAGYWPLTGKGQSGRTAEKIAGEAAAQVATSPIISMSRVMSAAGALAKGTLASSWVQSAPPSSNFEANRLGVHIGSPGAMPVTFPEPPAPTPEPAPAPVIPVAEADDIMITEIMVDTGNSRLPQWIELTNMSGAEKSLAGWSVQITNSGADADAVGSSVTIDLMGTLGVGGGMDKGGTLGKSLLLVAWSGRSSSNLDGSERVVNVSGEVGQRGRYKLISDMAFMIALIPPQKTGVLTYGDTAGNLDATEAWELPMSEDGRSSLIRREMLKDGTATMGTDANGWVLASSTALVTGHATWYGSDEDAGTPGSDAGGPLPVELSHFRPARDKQTGAVVITWATESELNNAGFFIKRSQQRNGEFKVINAAIVPGAGTTSEKQFYTYTDTTAQPNVVYYYQIEDVSLDGNRQTLTRGIRLKGHVGAAGKATVIWGELKTSHE